MLENLGLGLATAAAPANLLFCFLGVLIGTIVGVLPGIGALAAVSMLLPITYYLDPTAAVVMLAGVYYGGEYGGSIASILLNLPGTPSNAVTCLDGYPMAQQGRAGVALFMTTIGSFVGATFGILTMVAFSTLLAKFALSFGPSEYFAVMVLGLLAAATIGRGSPLNSLAMVVVGLLLGCVGTDVNSAVTRYSLGFYELYDGISLVALAMGIFGVSEVITSIGGLQGEFLSQKIRLRSMIPTRDDWRRSILPIGRGTAVGALFGALPGTGLTMASFMSYAVEKRVARDPTRLGTGAIEGVSAPEAANNAAAQTAFIPTMVLGIPGSPTMALILAALLIHGLLPGPAFMTSNPDIFWGLIASFWIGNILLVMLNIPLIGIWVRLLQVPYQFLYPAVISLICMGVYSVNGSAFDVVLVMIFGFMGYVMRLLDFEPAPLLLGFVLGPLLEENFRRAMLMARGEPMVLLERPISGTLLAIAVVLVAWALLSQFRGPKKASVAE